MRLETRKRLKVAAITGAAALVVATGVGGALVTTSGTVYDNRFEVVDEPGDGALVIEGDPISHVFEGTEDGEWVHGAYAVRNTTSQAAEVTMKSRTQVGDKLAGALRVATGNGPGPWVPAGTLADMTSEVYTIPAGGMRRIEVKVYVENASNLRDEGLAGSATTVDFVFDAMFN